MPVRLVLSRGTRADCSQAIPLIQGIEAEHPLADKGYDSNEIVEATSASGINPVIPPRSNRREPRAYDLDLYKYGIWWKIPSSISNSGGVWQPVMPKGPLLSWLSARSGPWSFGPNYFDDTI